MTSRLGLIAAALAVLSAEAADAAPRPAYVFAKPGVTLAAEEADEVACTAYVRGAPMPGLPPVTYAPTAAAAAGAALATGFLAGMERAKAQRRAYQRCMKSRGYAKLELTEAEAAALKGTKGEARAAWFSAFFASPGLAERVAAARAAVTELPEVAEQPFALGGLVLDPQSLRPAAAPVAQGQALLTGRASHRATARLAQPYAVSNALGIDKHAEASAVFHAVSTGPADTRWCGPFVNHSIRGLVTLQGCVFDDGEQFVVNDTNGQPWLAAPISAPGGFRLSSAPTLTLSDTDLIGPLDVELVAERIGKKAVSLALLARRDGKSVEAWAGQALFDEAGRATLPFWSQKLVLQRDGQGIRASLEPGGDGRGPDAR